MQMSPGKVKSLLFVVGLMLAIAPSQVLAQSSPGKQKVAGKESSDRVIALAVENELLSSEAVASHRIDVESNKGIVTLSGKVNHLLAKRQASRLAQQVKGVLAVINQIIVNPTEREDKQIAQAVRKAWADEPVIETHSLQVEVTGGKGILKGTVDSHTERNLAEEIAVGVAGLVGVENNITTKITTNRSDQEVREDVQALINSAVELGDADVQVKVKDGQVILNGRVGSAFAKSVAERKSWVVGATDVDVRGVKVDPDLSDGTRRRQRLKNLTDEQIVQTVQLAFRQDPRVLSYIDSIDVRSDAGSVTLSGKVGRLRVKEQTEKVARSTLGVWRVKNNLKVRWSGKEPTDREIIDYVQLALQRDPYVSRHSIRVHSQNAHVSLYGLVDTKFEKKAAGWIANGQKGVVHVNNYLAVAKKWKPKSDAEIKADIEEKLKFTFFDRSNDIEVTVSNGVAILRGKVDTWYAWQQAMNKAIEAGARRPHNLIKVRYHPRHGGSRIYVPR